MTQPGASARSPREELLRRLTVTDGWISPTDLFQGLPWGEDFMAEELAQLVLAERALYNARSREYRLAGEPMARKAAARLLRSGRHLEIICAPKPGSRNTLRLGLARRSPDGSAAMVEIELPAPTDPAGVQAMAHFFLQATQ